MAKVAVLLAIIAMVVIDPKVSAVPILARIATTLGRMTAAEQTIPMAKRIVKGGTRTFLLLEVPTARMPPPHIVKGTPGERPCLPRWSEWHF
ncbi:MAG: hypothetical protein M0Z34_01475 [Nitrospiraceae bacterium]|nr:hypothetical protein [Nitrospiraceae bacterium]